jgi:hypothetical protein
MNNSLLINNLRKKNSIGSQNISQTYNEQQTTQNTNYNNSDPSIKYNPDVEQNYSNVEYKRQANDYKYSTNMWKPIIGSVNKEKINVDDLKIQMDQPNHTKIKSDYELQLEQREKEKIIADKLAKEFAEINGLNKPIIEEITNQDDLNNMSNIDNTFIELKSSAFNISNDSSNLDIDVLISSMTKLDYLLDSVKNL